MRWILPHACKRHLVRAPEAFDLVPIYFLRSGPALGAAQNDHGPPRTGSLVARSRFLLVALYLEHTVLHRGCQLLMHCLRVATLDEVRCPAVAHEQTFQLVMRNPGEDGRVVDLVAVEMKDWQHCSVPDWVQELVVMPGSG